MDVPLQRGSTLQRFNTPRRDRIPNLPVPRESAAAEHRDTQERCSAYSLLISEPDQVADLLTRVAIVRQIIPVSKVQTAEPDGLAISGKAFLAA
jgi:hypothetical protein